MLTNSNFYIGDSSVSRIYQGENLVWDASHPDILCEWISNGDASTNPDVYFNTFMNPDLTLKVETKYSYHNRKYSGAAALFGSRSSSSASRYYLFTFAGLKVDGENYFTAKFWYKNAEGYSALVPTLDEPHTITTYGTYSSASAATYVNCILDSSVTSKAITITSGMSDTYQMYMFAINNQGTVDYRCLADTRIYYMKIWRDNNLTRFFIPVLHWLNGQYVPCFYDKVTDIYIYNLGTDTPTYKIQGDYLLDYLGSEPETAIPTADNASLRYDTGIVASNQLQTDIKARTVWGRENYLFGSGTSGQTTPTWQRYGWQTMGGSTDADLMRMRLDYGATNNSVTTYLSVDSSTIVEVNTLSMWYNTERGLYCFNGTRGITASPVPDIFSPETIYLFSIHATSSSTYATKGTRIYYANFTTSNIPTKTYIPVLHNNQAAFLDLNSGTYIYNIGTDAPYYQFKR